MSFADAVSNVDVMVMDKAALGLALEQNQKLVVFDAMQPGNLSRVIAGESVGTTIN